MHREILKTFEFLVGKGSWWFHGRSLVIIIIMVMHQFKI